MTDTRIHGCKDSKRASKKGVVSREDLTSVKQVAPRRHSSSQQFADVSKLTSGDNDGGVHFSKPLCVDGFCFDLGIAEGFPRAFVGLSRHGDACSFVSLGLDAAIHYAVVIPM